MLELTPGGALDFSDKSLEKLGGICKDLAEEVETQHRSLLANMSTWWDWFYAKPLTQTRSDPWANASNIVVPLIRIHSEAIVARQFNNIFAARDVWTARNRNEFKRPEVRSVIDFLNWAGDDNEFDLTLPVYDWLFESVPIGESVLKLSWTRRTRQMFLPGTAGRRITPTTVETHRGPHLEQIPRSDILWEADKELQDSEYVFQRSLMTYSKIARMSQVTEEEGGWKKDAVEFIRGRSGNPDDVREDTPHDFRPYDIREVWIEQPLLSNLKVETPGDHDASIADVPIVVTFHRDTGKVLRTIAHPYLIGRWPFYTSQYKRSNRQQGLHGLCRTLEHMQRGSSTAVNQGFDAVSLANSIVGITNDPKLRDQKIGPQRILYSSDPEAGFKQINLSKLIQPDVMLVNLLMGFSERLTNINDPNLGKETRLGGHPSPATSTLTLLQESREGTRLQMKLIRHEMSRLAEDIATLYQQYEMNETGRLQRVLGDQDGSMVEQWLLPTDKTVAGNMKFDLRAVSETLNPEEERNRALFVAQALTDYYSRMMQAVEVGVQAQQSQNQMMLSVVQKTMEGLTESYSRILDSSNVDDIERFVLDLKGASSGGQQAAALSTAGSEISDRLGQVATGNQGPAVPTGPDGLPLATNGRVGTSGI